MPAQFTLFYDGQFWCGLYETSNSCGLYATTVTFGSEPTNAELYDWLLVHGAEVVRRAYATKPVPGQVEAPTKGNPKRLRRSINKQKYDTSSSKAREALKLNFELEKAHRKKLASVRRQEEKEYKRAVLLKKKKEKHRGK